ncbi:hypothetical protein PGT21_034459 [Puccinia graminis f. sp. tritici]|uniref:Uncharacterized protein n=1 Tax=Puccinia graminis f. sp. tritici TaxID=56615 RepID=A0A5B0LLY6_PUCGR|nr:hypothetical protein PGTUg99_021662 [Puccinia graminis f. sp. tritici]KAA1095004.1 hypothetical protein PGT21_034459 [Puccinia graminis f. sp. tritici]
MVFASWFSSGKILLKDFRGDESEDWRWNSTRYHRLEDQRTDASNASRAFQTWIGSASGLVTMDEDHTLPKMCISTGPDP